MLCLLKNCGKCGGDLILDDSSWRCIQCAQYYYDTQPSPDGGRGPVEYGRTLPSSHGDSTSALTPPATTGLLFPPVMATEAGSGEIRIRRRGGREGYAARYGRSIDSFVQTKNAGEARWWDRNRQIIEQLDRGLSVREISVLTERGPRQIRVIRERLADLRASTAIE